MIRFTSGDIIRDEADALVNTVNCVGVMGRGTALQFKKAFPDNFEAYRKACHRDEVLPGRMFITERAVRTPVYRQFSDEAPLAGQEPDRGHRVRAGGSSPRNRGAGHQVDCDSGSW